MNKEILDAFIEQMTKILESGSALATKELPLVCKEILHYYLAYDIASILIYSACIVGIWCLAKYIKNKVTLMLDEVDTMAARAGIFAVSLVFTFLFAGFICSCGAELLKIVFAPRVFLLEFFRHLI